jgi:hypothetical protein
LNENSDKYEINREDSDVIEVEYKVMLSKYQRTIKGLTYKEVLQDAEFDYDWILFTLEVERIENELRQKTLKKYEQQHN